MKIVEYEEKYLEDIRDLLVELEEYTDNKCEYNNKIFIFKIKNC